MAENMCECQCVEGQVVVLIIGEGDLQVAGLQECSSHFFTPKWMPRNSASGANRQQRRRPQNGDTDNDRRIRFKPQPGHPDPNIRLDGQSKEQSFAHLEKILEPTRVVGMQGWKVEDKEEIPKDERSTQDDVWKHFWGDTINSSSTTGTTATQQLAASSNSS